MVMMMMMTTIKLMTMIASINPSINILFYVCSHRGDIRQKQKAKTYNNKQ